MVVTTLGQARKKSTKIHFLGPKTAEWGGRLPRKGVGVKTLVPSIESFFFEVRRREPGMFREFCRDVPDSWGCSKTQNLKIPDQTIFCLTLSGRLFFPF